MGFVFGVATMLEVHPACRSDNPCLVLLDRMSSQSQWRDAGLSSALLPRTGL